jgi:hypothetical protein
VQAIFRTMLYRRKKDSMLNGKLLVDLPTRDVQIVKLDFSQQEREIYNMVCFSRSCLLYR